MSRMLHMLSYSPALTRLAAHRRGVTGIVAAIAATVMLGFCGLAVDVVMWQVQQRTMQGAVDQAALAAATAYRNAGETVALGDSTAGRNGAYATALANTANWPGSAPAITVAAYNNGSGCTNDGCVKVTITQQQKRYFTGLFSTDAVNVSTSAVGTCSGCGTGSFTAKSGGGDACVMALDSSGTGVITASGTPTLSLVNCNLYNNSPNTSATILNGGALIEGCSTTDACGSQAFLAQPDIPSGNIDMPITTSASPVTDPLAGLTPPRVASGGCTGHDSLPQLSSSSHPGDTFCAPANNAIVNLAPGVYVIKGGLGLQGTTTITGTGVTLYVVGGSSTINGTSTIAITAPTSPPYAGVAVWFGDTSSVTYDGTNSALFSGVIYAPKTTVTWGGTNATGARCTRLIAGAIDLHGTPGGSFDNTNCLGIAGPVLTSSGVSGTTTLSGSPMLVQ
jgi:Flp pilus assembly protein TadG